MQALRDRVIELNEQEIEWRKDKQEVEVLRQQLEDIDREEVIILKNQEIENLRTQLETLDRDRTVEKDQEVARLKSEESADSVVDNKNKEIEELRTLAEDKGDQIAQLNDIIEALREDIQNLEFRVAEQSDPTLEQELSAAEENKTEQELRQEMAKMNQEIISLRNQVKEAEQLAGTSSFSVSSSAEVDPSPRRLDLDPSPRRPDLEETDEFEEPLQTHFESQDELLKYLQKKENAIITMRDQLSTMRRTLEANGIEIKSARKESGKHSLEEIVPVEEEAIQSEAVERVRGSPEATADPQKEIEKLQQELSYLRSMQEGGAVEEIKERDEEIQILREALSAMKSGEADLSTMLEEKNQSVSKLEQELDSFKVIGLNYC